MTDRTLGIVWHDVECGGYDGDLGLWEELASGHPGPILELGAGTGRVSLHLARRGHEVVAAELEPDLAAELRRRGEDEGLGVEVVVADARSLALDRRFGLVLAPMQFIQIFAQADDREAVLKASADHLADDGVVAAAVIDGVPEEAAPVSSDGAEALPDVREIDGFIYSSVPLGVNVGDGLIESTRRRQRVSPDGEIAEELHVDRLALIDAAGVEAEAAAAGLRPIEWVEVPPTEAHVGSAVVLLEARG